VTVQTASRNGPGRRLLGLEDKAVSIRRPQGAEIGAELRVHTSPAGERVPSRGPRLRPIGGDLDARYGLADWIGLAFSSVC
jgi:hypothetical protein